MKLEFSDLHNNIFNSNKMLTIIKAVAGSGKTTTMLELARRNPSRKYIYITYNKSSALDVRKKATNNVISSTFHSIAAQKYLNTYRHKLKNNINIKDVLKAISLKINRENIGLAKAIIENINEFQNSGYYNIKDVIKPIKDFDKSTVTIYTEIVWESMLNPNYDMPITHDTYLKIFHLNKDIINGLNIIFDEAQDASNVMIDILTNQMIINRTNIFVVGDENQSIYQFRYSNNAMMTFQSLRVEKNIFYLNKSYRFGKNIADISNLILSLKGVDANIIGVGGRDIIVRKIADGNKMAIIARTNETVLEMAIKTVDAGKSLSFVGGFDSYNMSNLIDIENLYLGRRKKISNQDILDYPSFTEFEKIAFTTQDYSTLKLISIVKTYAGKVGDKINLILKSIVDQSDADVILTNAHKSKGLEFDNVFLCNDFRCYYDRNNIKLQKTKDYDEEINLLYVASTRAKKRLRANKSLEQLLNNKKEP